MLSSRGDEGRNLLLSSAFDAAVLDVMLPELDGFSVLEQIRAQNCTVPVLMLTAKDTMLDIVHGLNLGADDYLTKPFQIQVFIARIRAIARRGPALRYTASKPANAFYPDLRCRATLEPPPRLLLHILPCSVCQRSDCHGLYL